MLQERGHPYFVISIFLLLVYRQGEFYWSLTGIYVVPRTANLTLEGLCSFSSDWLDWNKSIPLRFTKQSQQTQTKTSPRRQTFEMNEGEYPSSKSPNPHFPRHFLCCCLHSFGQSLPPEQQKQHYLLSPVVYPSRAVRAAYQDGLKSNTVNPWQVNYRLTLWVQS